MCVCVCTQVVRYLFEEGTEVPAGQPFVELEAMKMIMQVHPGVKCEVCSV